MYNFSLIFPNKTLKILQIKFYLLLLQRNYQIVSQRTLPLCCWSLGRDIWEMHVEERWGESVIKQLSEDLRLAIDEAKGLTSGNLYYCKRFYSLYNQLFEKVPQVGEIFRVFLGDGQKFLRPERRFDAYLVSHPELFVK